VLQLLAQTLPALVLLRADDAADDAGVAPPLWDAALLCALIEGRERRLYASLPGVRHL